MTYDSTTQAHRLDTLRTLHAQAEQASQAAAQAVGQQQQVLQAAQRKLAQLQSYAAQYRGQIAALGSSAAMWSQVRDLRAFVERIDAAIALQQEEIGRQQQRLEELKSQWAAARQREKAFSVLIDQLQAQQRQQQKTSVVKNLQEWAARRVSQFLPSTQQGSDF
jgi:flagellar FliJ protein